MADLILKIHQNLEKLRHRLSDSSESQWVKDVEKCSPRFSLKLWQIMSGWQNNVKMVNFNCFAGVGGSLGPSG